MAALWIKNTAGKEDAVLTMSFFAFVGVMVKFLFSGVSVSLSAGHSFSFGTVDAGVIAAILTPTLGAYVARRHTEAKHPAAPAVAAAKPAEKAVLTEEQRWTKE